MKRMSVFAVMMMALLVLSANVTYADPIGPDCGTCQGSIYLLQYDPNNTTVDGGTGDNVYDVFLTIDTSGYNAGGTFLDSVAIKISNSVDITTSSLVNAPGGAGAWALQFGGINAGGCDGSGSGFICASDGQSAPVPNATSYTWEFHYETADPLLLSGSSIKARYVDDNGDKVGALVSEDITLQSCTVGADCGGGGGGGGEVPEPGTIVLLGTGLLAVSFKLRRKLVRF